MKAGSIEADREYERQLMKQADKYFEPEYFCPWPHCGCKSDDEETCSECGSPMDGSLYWTCEWCGDIFKTNVVCCDHETVLMEIKK